MRMAATRQPEYRCPRPELAARRLILVPGEDVEAMSASSQSLTSGFGTARLQVGERRRPRRGTTGHRPACRRHPCNQEVDAVIESYNSEPVPPVGRAIADFWHRKRPRQRGDLPLEAFEYRRVPATLRPTRGWSNRRVAPASLTSPEYRKDRFRSGGYRRERRVVA